jgi:hypothetical protein
MSVTRSDAKQLLDACSGPAAELGPSFRETCVGPQRAGRILGGG